MIPRLLNRLLRLGVACAIGLASLNALADDAASLRARYAELREPLAHNNYKQALYIDSAQNGDNLKGDVYAVLDHPFSRVSGPTSSVRSMTLPARATSRLTSTILRSRKPSTSTAGQGYRRQLPPPTT